MDAVLTALAVIAILGAMLAAGVYFVKKAWFLLPLLIGVGLVYHGLKEMAQRTNRYCTFWEGFC
ncbi:hypothetical protein [Selenomonas sp. oral taxon 149]|uniref:hypothetical protein n=1 Tax=Selenomonas sp. oral taxon 149 TaxID=712535 RepID=UPI0001E097D2|nr:hypothetical protein [Selenomonas sp. oral taxon 149]EFM22928.1 hypothetical protein HMPREF9166_1509 [Selenomonas sp. oral taxon 149 str. 67H29BP]